MLDRRDAGAIAGLIAIVVGLFWRVLFTSDMLYFRDVFNYSYPHAKFIHEICRGGPDGMRVDEKGNVYSTGPSGIWIWDAVGTHLGTVILPEGAANFNWGDSDYRTLYIAGRTSVYRLKTKARGFLGSLAR